MELEGCELETDRIVAGLRRLARNASTEHSTHT